jgi:hypothetical protein
MLTLCALGSGMFEGKLLTTHAGLPTDRSDGGQRELRAISWSELVAQFDAARELRSALGTGEAGSDASFAPEPARHIAALCDGKPDVNLDALANRKQGNAISRSATNGAARDDRENR